jgi:predicted porin
MLGAKYTIGSVSMYTGYWKMGSPQDASNVWLGASVRFGFGTVMAQVQRMRQNNPAGAEREGKIFGLGYTYSLSKRTTLYASYGRVSNNATGLFSIASSDVSVAAGGAGADPSALGFGVRHNF